VGFTYTPVILNHYPREDGIIFMNPALGSNTPNNDITFYSNVLIHEVGYVACGELCSFEKYSSHERFVGYDSADIGWDYFILGKISAVTRESGRETMGA